MALAAGGGKVPADRGKRQFCRVLGTLAELEPAADTTFADLVNSLDYRFLRDSYVVAVLLDAEGCAYSTVTQLQEHRQSVRIVETGAAAFHNIFQPPAMMMPEQPAELDEHPGMPNGGAS